MLWDEESNFYLIDISDVRSDVPQYPSHIWLLYKAADGSGYKKVLRPQLKPSSMTAVVFPGKLSHLSLKTPGLLSHQWCHTNRLGKNVSEQLWAESFMIIRDDVQSEECCI